MRLQAAALGKPMLLVHGDGHRYRIDQPLTDPLTFDTPAQLHPRRGIRLPDVNWVRVDVRPDSERVFTISPGQQP